MDVQVEVIMGMTPDNSNQGAQYWEDLLARIEEQSKRYRSKECGSCTVNIQPDRLRVALRAFWPPEREREITLTFNGETLESITLAVKMGAVPVQVTSDFRGSQRLAKFHDDLLSSQQLAKRILELLTQPASG